MVPMKRGFNIIPEKQINAQRLSATNILGLF